MDYGLKLCTLLENIINHDYSNKDIKDPDRFGKMLAQDLSVTVNEAMSMLAQLLIYGYVTLTNQKGLVPDLSYPEVQAVKEAMTQRVIAMSKEQQYLYGLTTQKKRLTANNVNQLLTAIPINPNIELCKRAIKKVYREFEKNASIITIPRVKDLSLIACDDMSGIEEKETFGADLLFIKKQSFLGLREGVNQKPLTATPELADRIVSLLTNDNYWIKEHPKTILKTMEAILRAMFNVAYVSHVCTSQKDYIKKSLGDIKGRIDAHASRLSDSCPAFPDFYSKIEVLLSPLDRLPKKTPQFTPCTP